jgi:NitT/TauT family transport system permease protein
MYSGLSYQAHRENPDSTTIPNLRQFREGIAKICAADSNGHRWIFQDTAASTKRIGYGLAAGVVLSLVVGIAMGCFTPVEAFLLPPVSFLARIPPTAMLAVYFAVFGITFQLFVAMVALGVFPTLAQAIYQAARKDVSDHAVYKAYTLGASPMEVITQVVIRQILPRIIENVRLQVGPAMVFLIAAEWALADVGFGYRLRMQSRLLHMNVVYTYLILLGVGGFFFDWLLATLRRRLCRWFGD